MTPSVPRTQVVHPDLGTRRPHPDHWLRYSYPDSKPRGSCLDLWLLFPRPDPEYSRPCPDLRPWRPCPDLGPRSPHDRTSDPNVLTGLLNRPNLGLWCFRSDVWSLHPDLDLVRTTNSGVSSWPRNPVPLVGPRTPVLQPDYNPKRPRPHHDPRYVSNHEWSGAGGVAHTIEKYVTTDPDPSLLHLFTLTGSMGWITYKRIKTQGGSMTWESRPKGFDHISLKVPIYHKFHYKDGHLLETL